LAFPDQRIDAFLPCARRCKSITSILAALHDMKEAPWGDLRGKPLDDRGLAKRLHAYGIKSTNVRLGTATPEGYRREDL
jgi:Protein of unknown function (DUF3631)